MRTPIILITIIMSLFVSYVNGEDDKVYERSRALDKLAKDIFNPFVSDEQFEQDIKNITETIVPPEPSSPTQSSNTPSPAKQNTPGLAPNSPKPPTPVYSSCKPYIGVTIQGNIDDGVFVQYVDENTPAQQAGLTAGDVIRYFNGVRVRYTDDVLYQISRCRGGQEVIVEVKSINGRYYRIPIVIGCR